MNFYLSSYLFGDDYLQLKELLPPGARIGHITNAKDWADADENRKQRDLQAEMDFLEQLGFVNEHLDLKAYFGKTEALKHKLATLDGIWVCGGNTFILRQAMRLSGFDQLFEELRQREDFLWAGYSAGACILSDSLKYIQHVDDPTQLPYAQISTPIFEGLGFFNYGILPHYDSNHFESAAIEVEIQTCIRNKWLFKAIRDGEVLLGKGSSD
ncbi:Type 1 glutamine amidotransferase-like domain-containing protein [Myroides sp. WP-1]|uniref:Type 1 glutamine amidotransferase-like domain-containing protein n=1 Tax=Myroides sp. WP-1 TaxID=2759944 RepID=UPI0015F9B937|nr:Type 1 glutamine amidotransferase-like domain-containing protein [Myroides sp. WP-1]MBB1139931.1 Type 1 glutamine amidotransferase-like domain-containing protein [Myroides sp. WP-1]